MGFVGTFEFFTARTGKLTASRMAIAMEFLKNGKESAARARLKKEIVAERLTDSVVRHYVTDSMRWGSAEEDDAKAMYTRVTGRRVEDCGFYDHFDIDHFGATPDGLVGSDGLIETKCPETTTHIGWMLAGAVPDEHKPQMLVQLACTGREWVDFVSYDSRIKDPKRQIFIRRFSPSRDDIDAIEQAARGFLAEVDAMFDSIASLESMT